MDLLKFYFSLTYAAVSLSLGHRQGVISPPKIHRQPDKEVVFASGEAVRLNCEASGSPEPQYTWKRNGQSLPLDGHRLSMASDGTGALIINLASVSDQGYYQCFAFNEHGVSLSVKTHLIAALLDSFPDSMEIRNLIAVPGEPFTLRCMPPRSIPRSSHYWALDVGDSGRPLVPIYTDKRVAINPEGDLMFAHVQKSDEREGRGYVCVVMNDVLRMTVVGPRYIIQVWEMPEQFPMTWLLWVSPRDQFALVGQDLRLWCFSGGNPTPEVTWEWNTTTTSTVISKSDIGRALVFRNVTKEIEGTYTCQGKNRPYYYPQVATSWVNIRVEAAPFWISRPRDKVASIGESATFTCEASGIPLPTTQWLINGRPISEMTSAASITASSNSITIDSVRLDSSANVQCNVTNKHGYVFAEASLTVNT